MNSTSPDDATPHEEGGAVPLIDEFLDVEKRTVDQGGYKLTRRVETHKATVDELLRHHQVSIERRHIGTQLATPDAPQPYWDGQTLVIPVIEEILVTEKRFVLVEEVRITPTETVHRHQETVDLRKEEIVVERLAPQGDAEPTT